MLEGTPWCYYKQGYSACVPSLSFTPGPGGYGFTDEFHQEMLGLYENQLNINGSGAVAAALDHGTPGGDYFYHWMRDGALSMRSLMQINDVDEGISADVYTKMRAYVAWVSKVQNQQDPNQIDVRIEPKFEIPSGEPYSGGWCRPQTDGPGLRAGTLIIWANALAKSVSRLRDGQGAVRESEKVRDEVNDVWNLVLTDLAWVEQNGLTANGCDLWEEVQSQDFLWNRMGYAYTLYLAQQFATDVLHDAGQAATLQSKMNDVVSALSVSGAHWDGDHFVSSSVRPIDGSVLHAVASFGEKAIYATSSVVFTPISEETAKTISHYNEVFCAEYPLNNQDTTASVPGVLYGRYPGDTYAGGNPWQLLSASLAEVFYLAASQLAAEVASMGDNDLMTDSQLAAWQKVLGSTSDYTTLVTKMVDAGDSVLQRIYTHVKNDGGRIDEQIDKNTGSQTSAKGLTWSYANLLHALHLRKSVSFEQRVVTIARNTKRDSSGRTMNAPLYV
jgi:glucoamylase